VSQGLLWLSIDELGEVSYSFTDIMASMVPYYGLRLVGGLVFLSGTILMSYNLLRTMYGRHTVMVHPPEVIDELKGTRHNPDAVMGAPAANGTEVPA